MFRRTRTATSKLTNRINKWSRFSRPSLQYLEDRSVPATFTVNAITDTGTGAGLLGDLRFCVDSSVAGDTINFDAVVFTAGTTILLGSPLLVDHDLTIDGTSAGGAANVNISGNNAVTVFNTKGSTNDVFTGITIKNGKSTSGGSAGGGGAVSVFDVGTSVTFDNVVVSGNVNSSTGGAISMPTLYTGTITINNSTFSGNTSSASGGAVYFWTTGTLSVSGSSFIGNTASGTGGAMYIYSGTATISNSSFTGNKSSSAGGAITQNSSATTTVTNSTISGNTAPNGGGIRVQYGTFDIRNSTVAFNSTTGNGGGIQHTGGTLNVSSTIVSDNTATGTGPDVAGTVALADQSLFSNDSGLTITTNNGSVLNKSPNLSALALNGGKTLNHLPGPGPAVDAGNDAFGLGTDQRGATRVQGLAADIGSVETTPTSTPFGTGTGPSITVQSASPETITVTYGIGVGVLDGSKVGTGDIIVTGPNGYSQTATLTNGPFSNAASIVATYSVPANAGGSSATDWDPLDNGSYALNLQANEIFDSTNTKSAAAGVIGNFKVNIPTNYIVNATTDTGAGSGDKGDLRYAINQFNAGGGLASITFDAAVFAGVQVISLTSELKISAPVSIVGPGADHVTIDGGGLVRVFNVSDGTASKINVSISGVSIANGKGGINNDGEILTLDSSFVHSNTTTTSGGGINFTAVGDLTITNSTISGNSASGAGGAAYFRSGSNINIRNSTIANNTSSGVGGAIGGYSTSAGTVVVTNSTVTGNKASTGGAFRFTNASYSAGVFSMESSIVSGNNGPAASPDFYAYKVTSTNSIIGSATGIGMGGVNDLGGTIYGDPMFNPAGLTGNGGPTPTIAILAGSPVIDTGSNPAPALSFDQRGTGFARVAGAAADMGALESDPNVPGANGTGPTITVVNATPETITVTYTVGTGTIKASTLDNLDIVVTGPGGYSQPATLTGGPYSDLGTIIATYTVPPNNAGINGQWDKADNGTYTITINAGQVTTGSGTPIAPGNIGSFKVAIPVTYLVDEVSDLDDNDLSVGKLSFREAIKAANADGVASIIAFDAAIFTGTKTITMAAGEMAITQGVSITGPAGGLILDAAKLSRIFNIDPGTTSDVVSISNMTATNGKVVAANGGGIINNDAALILTNVTVSKSTSDIDGGGISVSSSTGSLNLTDVVVTGNSATGNYSNGGGIHLSSGSAVTLSRSTVSNNVSAEDGGGIYFFSGGSLTMDDSTVSGNSGNTVTSSAGGGGIYLFATTTVIRNSTISGNSAKNAGGGIGNFAGSIVTIKNSTIAFNVTAGNGGGIGGSSVTLNSVIVANNTAGGTGPDVNGAVAADFTLFSNNSGATITGANNVENLSANLTALGNYGGPTQTHGLLTGSNALNAGNNADTLANDQRGAGFPRQVGAAVDIGAFEGILPNPSGVLTLLGPVVSAGATPNTVEVIYTDDVGINASSIDTGDIEILNPALVPLAITGVVFTPSGTGGKAVYTFTVPGGAWDIADNGKYSVNLLANQVSDTDLPTPNSAFAGNLGSFLVAIPAVYLVDEVSDIDDGILTVGKLSIREAIKAANGDSAPSIINFSATAFAGTQTITLSGGVMAINNAVTVNGPTGGLVLDAATLSRIFDTSLSPAAAAIAISKMTLTNGSAAGSGGAILVGDEALTLSQVTVSKSAATGDGGGIQVSSSAGSLTLTDCIISNNNATTAGSFGGGINLSSSSAVSITRTTISGNTAFANGGGISFSYGGKLTMTSSTVSGNNANISDTNLGGGGIYFFADGTHSLVNSTISGNSAAGAVNGYGGGIAFNYFYIGTLSLSNCTVTNNSSTKGGGGISGAGGFLTLSSSIVSGNVDPISADMDLFDPYAVVPVAGDNNLVGVADVGNFTLSGAGNLTGTQAAPLDALLGPLASNGGPTQTHALLTGSPALNAGNNTAALAFDQRGNLRVVGVAADIGAYEVQAPAKFVSVVINDGSGQRSVVTSITVNFGQHIGFTAGAAAAFTLNRVGDNAAVNLAAIVDDSGSGTSVILTFTGGAVNFASLADGRYNLNILASGFNAEGFDGNNSGTAQGSTADDFLYDQPPSPSPLNLGRIFRFFGDFNGDGDNDASDFIQFRLALGGSSPTFDFDFDGAVAASDFIQYRIRFSGQI